MSPRMQLWPEFVGKFLTWWVVRFSPRRLNHQGKSQSYPLVSTRVGPITRQDTVENRKVFVPFGEQTSIPRWSSP
jgi:hypothetical protein